MVYCGTPTKYAQGGRKTCRNPVEREGDKCALHGGYRRMSDKGLLRKLELASVSEQAECRLILRGVMEHLREGLKG